MPNGQDDASPYPHVSPTEIKYSKILFKRVKEGIERL
jgi:hypothetical protein